MQKPPPKINWVVVCKSTVVAPSSHYTRTALLGNVQQLRDGARLVRECLSGDSETGGTSVQGERRLAEGSEPYRSVPPSSTVVGQSKSTDALTSTGLATATTCRPAKPRVTPAIAKQIVADYQAGAAVAELAAQYGFHRQTVSRVLRTAGVVVRQNATSNEEIERIKRLRAEGKTIREIMWLTRRSKNTVRRWAR